MRFTLLIASCVLVAVSDALLGLNIPILSSVTDLVGLDLTKDVDFLFPLFQKLFGRVYSSKLEETLRKTIFKRNLDEIKENNLLHLKGLSTFTMTLNHLSDMHPTEILTLKTGYLPSNVSYEKTDPSHLHVSKVYQGTPHDVDWRERGYVTPVKEQGLCGACWTFSANVALEGQHFKKTGSLVDLSEQQLLDCSKSSGTKGCDGGWPAKAFNYIASHGGIDTDESYPYTGKQGPVCKYNDTSVGANCTGYKTVQANEMALKEAVGSVGPISIAIDASLRTFQFYKEGVYYDPECKNTSVNHAVAVVGYGTDSDGNDYWIVKNSWGDGWGMEGYILMARNKDNHCGVASHATYPIV